MLIIAGGFWFDVIAGNWIACLGLFYAVVLVKCICLDFAGFI